MVGNETPDDAPGKLDLDHLARWAEVVAQGGAEADAVLDRTGQGDDEGGSMTVLDGDLMPTDEDDLAERVAQLEAKVIVHDAQIATHGHHLKGVRKAVRMIARALRAGSTAESILDALKPPPGSRTG